MRKPFSFITFFTYLVSAFVFFGSHFAHAAVVKATKDNKILVDMQSDSFKVGDILKVEDSHGKTVAMIKVNKIKGSSAEGIFKGKPEKGMKVSLKPAGSSSPKKSASSSSGSHSKKGGEFMAEKKYGIMFGLVSSGSDTKLTSGAKTSMTGTGFALKGIMDTSLLSWLDFRGMAGFQQFNVTGKDTSATADCGGGDCNAKILYLGGDAIGRVMFTKSIWAGLGASLLFPMTKSSTAIATGSISNTLVYDVAGGFDMHLASGAMIPIQFDYDIFPSSSTVTAHMLSLRIGYSAW